MSPLVLQHPGIVLDACSLINFYASGHAASIFSTISGFVATTEYVKVKEATKIYAEPVEGITQPTEKIDLTQLIEAGLLHIIDLASEEEQLTFVSLAANIHAGEAATAAAAYHHNLAIVTDDRQARNFLTNNLSNIQMFATLDIIKHWEEVSSVSREITGLVLRNIRVKARYKPRNSDVLFSWWEERMLLK